MKKSTTKLRLQTTTIRLLQGAELKAVRGGGGENDDQREPTKPSNDPMACSAVVHRAEGTP